ncbi:MAG TPA: DUF4199 domain-containing protein [Thermoanaerobaculia bacterium]|nr:DUF4199 domain-containing protein [Thermoanaerobaculia bacterium]
MKKIVLRFGLASGATLVAISAVMTPLVCMRGTIDFDHSEILGYSAMVLSFLLLFFGVRSYRDNVGGGAISFGKAFQVGLLITLITCAMYVIAWEITYFNFFPNFLDQYSAHVLAKMRSTGASEAAIRETTTKMAFLAKNYHNLFFNSAITFMEVFPVGLIMTLISAAILRRKPRQEAPASSAVPA